MKVPIRRPSGLVSKQGGNLDDVGAAAEALDREVVPTILLPQVLDAGGHGRIVEHVRGVVHGEWAAIGPAEDELRDAGKGL
jgi:hypothetical protein